MLEREDEDFQTVFASHKIGRLANRKGAMESSHLLGNELISLSPVEVS